MNNVVAALALTALIVLIISFFGSQTGYVIEPNAANPEDNSTYPPCESESDYPEPSCPEDTTPYAECDSCCEECEDCLEFEECEECTGCDSCCPEPPPCPPAASEENCQQYCGDGGEPQYLYVGSVYSDKYHYPNCTHAQKIKPENEIWFEDEEDAKNQGYVPCGVCKPPG